MIEMQTAEYSLKTKVCNSAGIDLEYGKHIIYVSCS